MCFTERSDRTSPWHVDRAVARYTAAWGLAIQRARKRLLAFLILCHTYTYVKCCTLYHTYIYVKYCTLYHTYIYVKYCTLYHTYTYVKYCTLYHTYIYVKYCTLWHTYIYVKYCTLYPHCESELRANAIPKFIFALGPQMNLHVDSGQHYVLMERRRNEHRGVTAEDTVSGHYTY